MSRQRWLWLTAELPADASTGRLVYSGNLVSAVADAGADVTMVGLAGAEHDGRHGAVTWVAVPGALRGGRRSLLSQLPNLSYACSGPTMRSAVEQALRAAWDVIVIDHLQMAWVVPLLRQSGGDATVVFVTHNHEASVRRTIAREVSPRSPRRVVLTVDALKAARLERRALAAAGLVTSITDDDRRMFERDAPGTRHLVLPPGWSGRLPERVTPMGERPRRVGIMGSFEWHVKRENLRQFLAAADPVFSAAGVELVVGGRVLPEFIAAMTPALRATTFVGWVDDPAEFLGTCRLGVIAEPLGGGFKLKALDYVFHSVAIAAVRGSVAGLPLVDGVSLIDAPDHESLAGAIVRVIDDADRLTTMTAAARRATETGYSWVTRGKTLVSATNNAKLKLGPGSSAGN